MSTIYDYAGSLRRMGEDHALFQEMVGLLCSDAPPLLHRIGSAQDDSDWPELARAAHTLKGLAANFGAARAVSAAAEVERLAKYTQIAGLTTAVKELHEAVDELIGVLSLELAASHAR